MLKSLILNYLNKLNDYESTKIDDSLYKKTKDGEKKAEKEAIEKKTNINTKTKSNSSGCGCGK